MLYNCYLGLVNQQKWAIFLYPSENPFLSNISGSGKVKNNPRVKTVSG
jgi:hypothetical protein